jgi:O-antigen/teichoic acid export membrane protein
MNAVMKSQAVLVSAHAGRLALSLAVASLLGRNLSPADFGFVALVTSIYIIALELLDMGTTATATREAASDATRERDTLIALLSLRRLLAAGAVAVVLLLAASGYVARGDHRLVFAVAALGLFALHLHGYQIPFQLRQDYGPITALQVSSQVGFLAASAVALKLHAGGTAIALLIVAREAGQALGMRHMALRRLGTRLSVPWRWRDSGAAKLFGAAWRIGVAGLAYKLTIHAGGFMLWALDSPGALGTFNAAQRLLLPMADMAWLVVIPLIAAMSATARRDSAAFRTQLERHLTLLMALSAVVAVAGWFIAPILLRLLYGDLYAAGPWSAVATFRCLALGYLFALVTPVLVVGELVQGHAQALLGITASALALNLAVNSWAVRAYGPQGAALVLAACEAYVFVVLFSRSLSRGEIRMRAAWALYLVPAALLIPVLWWLAPLMPGASP